jgi:hypothetical protein
MAKSRRWEAVLKADFVTAATVPGYWSSHARGMMPIFSSSGRIVNAPWMIAGD